MTNVSDLANRPRVDVIVFVDDLFQGVMQYVREHPDCPFRPQYQAWPLINHLAAWEGAALIVHIFFPWVQEQLLALRRPVVNVSQTLESLEVPSVLFDNPAVGRMGAEYLMRLGLEHFAFVGEEGYHWSTLRRQGFVETLTEAGRSCASTFVFPDHLQKASKAAEWPRRAIDWVRSLPKPVGVMTCNDLNALHVYEACHTCGVRIPEDIALLGAGDDTPMGPAQSPPLSTVRTDWRRLGYEAAALMRQLLEGDPAPNAPVFVAPTGVTERHSTDVLAVDDPVIIDAVRFLRAHAHEPINIHDLVRHSKVSRRSLERRFTAALHCTPLDQLHELRVEKVKQMLTQTSLSLEAIAQACGFKHDTNLYAVFQQRAGMTPGQYRKRFAR